MLPRNIFYSIEMINVTHYGSVNTSIQDVTRRRRQSQSPVQNEGPPMVEKMRRRLQFYFMNPMEKWHVKRQFPYKLAIQLIKIFFVTFQVHLHLQTISDYVLDNSANSFNHLIWFYCSSAYLPHTGMQT